jgi:Flp pilus assembly pilin Flp
LDLGADPRGAGVAGTGAIGLLGDVAVAVGQGLAEYALILALIAIIAILARIFLGSQIAGILSNVGTSV